MIKKYKNNNLVDMYSRIKSEKDLVIEELHYDIKNNSIPLVIDNIMSLQAAAEMSLKLL